MPPWPIKFKRATTVIQTKLPVVPPKLDCLNLQGCGLVAKFG